MKAILIFLSMLLAVLVSLADTWKLVEPKAYTSPTGKYVVRIIPGNLELDKSPVAIIFILTDDASSYSKVREFPLLNRLAPVSTCISDTGDLYTFDDWGGIDKEYVAVWYSSKGKVKTKFTLDQFLSKDLLTKLKAKHGPEWSANWRRGEPRFNGSSVIVYDSLGGYVHITGASACRYQKGNN